MALEQLKSIQIFIFVLIFTVGYGSSSTTKKYFVENSSLVKVDVVKQVLERRGWIQTEDIDDANLA
jgi:hypothetical protein